VNGSPPTIEDFTSLAPQGKPVPPTDADAQRLWDGISAFDTQERVMGMAVTYSLGSYVSMLDIPEEAAFPVRVEKTRGPGHYTVWGDAATLLSAVHETTPVPPQVLR